tara:strand:- start:1271 stop:2725 length:1455 start_codon:yes stop_codon:yes gene_type:complete
MISYFRKFSSSIYSKIFLFIVAIPFVFWGMGPLFTGGNINTVAKIGKGKITTEEFIGYVKYNASQYNVEELNKTIIQNLLSQYIGDKLINYEIQDLGIKLTDKSLSEIIKNEKLFKKDNKFSRTEYEKFLVKNGIGAIVFENDLSNKKKKEQLFEFIGGGIVPADFFVNKSYNKINQKRYIEIIDLNKIFDKELSFSQETLNEYYENNKNNYISNLTSVDFIELSPKNLTGSDEFTDLFFQKIDVIDNMIAEGNNLNSIINSFNLNKNESATFNTSAKNKSDVAKSKLTEEFVKKISHINEEDSIIMLEHNDKYFIVEFVKNENKQRKISDKLVREDILFNLQHKTKRNLISQLMAKVNSNNFKKTHFDKFSKVEKVAIEKITLQSMDDNKVLNEKVVEKIYSFPEKRVFIINNISLSENYLIYIDKIESATIAKNSEDYKKYLNLSKLRLVSNLYNTYDIYLKQKYKIDINYKALDTVNNYFK